VKQVVIRIELLQRIKYAFFFLRFVLVKQVVIRIELLQRIKYVCTSEASSLPVFINIRK
jgi:hypothetical protein